MTFAKTILFASCAATALAGCSIHPLPEDVTPDTTTDIVNKIRCEARDAIELWTQRGIAESGPAPRDLLNRYAQSGIAFKFSLTMSEADESSLGLTFKDPLGRGTFGLGLGGGQELKRKNVRDFTIATTFAGLRSELSAEFCSSASAPGENFRYPITGRIGLDELIFTFLSLAESGGLKIIEDNELPDLSDTLTFETKVSGGFDPSIELTPMTSGFHLAAAMPHHKSERTDIHEVAVGLTLPQPGGGGTTGSNVERAAQGLQLLDPKILQLKDLERLLLE